MVCDVPQGRSLVPNQGPPPPDARTSGEVRSATGARNDGTNAYSQTDITSYDYQSSDRGHGVHVKQRELLRYVTCESNIFCAVKGFHQGNKEKAGETREQSNQGGY
ncbi:hypothetical protein RRG08_043546 [Elysia crispata]|uniref:Uncharacterized protein n=1 Tax=Elysia crispata TaxID=231223 RepID=A0AAE0YFW8_9GAST|nr:hypothetical protein RRG08_043546 [Elysia crispata]